MRRDDVAAAASNELSEDGEKTTGVDVDEEGGGEVAGGEGNGGGDAERSGRSVLAATLLLMPEGGRGCGEHGRVQTNKDCIISSPTH